MNVPRDRLNNKKDGTEGEYPPMTAKVRSNVELSEADVFRETVKQVVARNKLDVDKELLDRYIDARIASGDMLERSGTAISRMGAPKAFNEKHPNDKGYSVAVDSDFQKAIASFAKSPTETLARIEREKPPVDTPAQGSGSKTGDPSAVANTPATVGEPASGTATGKPSSESPLDPPVSEYGVPPGKTLGEVAGGRDSQPIDVTLSRLASAVYRNDAYGSTPEGWHEINAKDIADRLGVAQDDPKVSEWFRKNLGGEYALEGDDTKKQEFRAGIYTDGKGNFVLAYRGTAEGIPDWYDNNTKQALGFTTDGEKDKFSGTAVSTAQEFVKLFGQYDASGKPTNLAMVGHSQGGGLATMGSLATGVPAVTFDASGIHPNTLSRIDLTPEAARKYAENGNIRAYSLKDDALTNVQESKGIIGTLAPDALGTKIRLNPAKDKDGRLMEEYGESIIGGPRIMRRAIDNGEIPIFVGTLGACAIVPKPLPLNCPVVAVGAALAPNQAISHFPTALTDALIDHKPWLPKPVPPTPTPGPTPTPTPESTPESTRQNPTNKIGPIPQPVPTPTPKSNQEPNNLQSSLDDPTHPRNGMFRQALGLIQTKDTELGRGSDDTTLRLAAGVTAEARARGLDTIAFAQFSEDGRRFLMADTRDPSLPWARTAVGDVGQALQQNISDSTQRIEQLDQAQALTRQQSQPTEQQDLKQSGPVIQGPKLV